MSKASTIESDSFVRNAKLPWVAFLFFAAVFFIAEHKLFFPLMMEDFSYRIGIAKAVAEGSLGRRVVFSMLGLFGVLSLMSERGNRLKINGLLGWFVLVYLMWCFISLAWADDVGLTFRRLVLLAMLSLGALAASQRFSLRNTILLAFFITILYLLTGLLVEVVLGTFRPMTPGYRFAGTVHPNQQGIHCAILLLVAVSLAGTPNRGRSFFLVAALIALIFLILTKSRTAFAAAILALFAYWILVSSGRHKLALILGVSLAFCLLLLLFGDGLFPALRQGILLGREDSSTYTLSGRIPLWKQGLQFAARNPWLGYGYKSFFTPSRVAEFSATQGWELGGVHSAYLELLLSLGPIGMVLYVLIFGFGIGRSVIYYRASRSTLYAFFCGLFVFCLFDGLLEIGFSEPSFLTFLSWVILARLAFNAPMTIMERAQQMAKTKK